MPGTRGHYASMAILAMINTAFENVISEGLRFLIAGGD
jgi:hypothetical protein